VEITPELCVRLASAYATTLKKGAVVTTSRDVSRAARAFKRAVQGALNASAIDVVDLEAQPLPVARFRTARSEAGGGIALRTTPGNPQSIDIIFLDERGAELSQAAARKLERVFSRQEYRRAFPGEIAELSYPPRVVESYAADLVQSADMTGVREAELKVVVDCAGGTASLVLPELLGRIGLEALTVNNRLDEGSPTQSLAQMRAGMQRLSELVASSRADFGVRCDQVGERIQLVDDKGAMVSDDRALLVVLDLIAAERRSGRGALPVTPTRVAAGGAGPPAGDHPPRRREGVPFPRGAGGVDPDLAARPHRGDRGRRRDLRGGRPGRVCRARDQPDPGWHRGVRPPARAGRAHPPHPQPDRRPDPQGPSAQALDADAVGGQGQRHAHGGGGRGQPGDGHHRRRTGDRAQRGLGAGAARPGGRGHASVGRGSRRRLGPGAARRVGDGG